jgi:hypothetical protein
LLLGNADTLAVEQVVDTVHALQVAQLNITSSSTWNG